jgi:TonB family protein
MGTALQGDGPNSFGLSGTGNGLIGGRGNGKGGGGGTKYGWYAGQVQARVLEAMQRHRKLRSSALTVQVRIWADSNGRVTRAKVSGTSGDAAIDQALEREVLTGLQLSQPPPDGMPMPIVMRITARRPN